MKPSNLKPTHSHKKIKIERKSRLNSHRRINGTSISSPIREPSLHPTIVAAPLRQHQTVNKESAKALSNREI